MSKFILHEDLEIFSTHGSMYLKDLYDKYVQNGSTLPSDLHVAGIKRGREYRFEIKSIQEVYIKCCEIVINGVGMNFATFYVHPKQKMWAPNGNELTIDEITQPFTTVVTKNGGLMINSVGNVDEPKRFFIIETGYESRTFETVPSIIVGNFVMLPMTEQEVDDTNPFLISEEELLEQ